MARLKQQPDALLLHLVIDPLGTNDCNLMTQFGGLHPWPPCIDSWLWTETFYRFPSLPAGCVSHGNVDCHDCMRHLLQMFMHLAYRRRSTPNLTYLELGAVQINLDQTLHHVRRQLHALKLGKECVLLGPGLAEVFAAGWDSLTRLELLGACLESQLSAVRLPRLQQLSLVHVSVKKSPESNEWQRRGARGWVFTISDDEDDLERYFCADIFAHGCPNVTSLEYSQKLPRRAQPDVSCTNFSAVEEVTMWLDRLPRPANYLAPGTAGLPIHVTSLTFRAAHLQTRYLQNELAFAGSCIEGGGLLRELHCQDCISHGAGGFAQAAACLGGLTRLSLFEDSSRDMNFSPNRFLHSVKAMNALLAALPNLQSLEMPIGMNSLAHASLVCHSLAELELRFRFTRFQDTSHDIATRQGLMREQCKHRELIVRLDGTACMRKFAIRMVGYGWHGARVTVHLHGCCSAVQASVEHDMELNGRLIISFAKEACKDGSEQAVFRWQFHCCSGWSIL
jgi:hypothetical protein